MKRFTTLAAGAALTVAASTALPVQAQAREVLDTPGYKVTITRNCEEGNVTCDDVRYTGTSKKSGKSITLRGKTLHSTCRDGVTPCAFQGYVFRSGRVTYTIHADGRLVVTEGAKTLVNQRGKWM